MSDARQDVRVKDACVALARSARQVGHGVEPPPLVREVGHRLLA
jgi:hypothetical protein